MVWFRVDDRVPTHPKFMRIPRAQRLAAAGLWMTAGAWCVRQGQDGVVPDYMIEEWAGTPELVEALARVGLWEPHEDGWKFHDWADYQFTRAEVDTHMNLSKRRKSIQRDQPLRESVRSRDGNHCRFCGVLVRWSDRRSNLAGTYTPIDWDRSDTVQNVVVACRGCADAKGDKTPGQAGMTLLAPHQAAIKPESSPGSSSDLGPDQAPHALAHAHAHTEEELLAPPDGGAPSAKEPKPNRTRGERIPQPFLLTAAMREWAATETPGVDVTRETKVFVDHWRGTAGAKGVKLDWIATWRNWMRRAQGYLDDRGTGAPSHSGPPKPDDFAAASKAKRAGWLAAHGVTEDQYREWVDADGFEAADARVNARKAAQA